MNEFSIINKYFNKTSLYRNKVIVGRGDDAACLEIPLGYQLLISTDNLVVNKHFLLKWDPKDIGWRSVAVNVSDIIAMGGKPIWLSLALTMPDNNNKWLQKFSAGLHKALKYYNLDLIGGNLTQGELNIAVCIHGLVLKNKFVLRSTAKPMDKIYVTGNLGSAAYALKADSDPTLFINKKITQKLLTPKPSLAIIPIIQKCASASIDISDGLSADLHHLCQASKVGALLFKDAIPIDKNVKSYAKDPLNLALTGGDDYELCFTVPKDKEDLLKRLLLKHKITCYCIGQTERKKGLRLQDGNRIIELKSKGYLHFV